MSSVFYHVIENTRNSTNAFILELFASFMTGIGSERRVNDNSSDDKVLETECIH